MNLASEIDRSNGSSVSSPGGGSDLLNRMSGSDVIEEGDLHVKPGANVGGDLKKISGDLGRASSSNPSSLLQKVTDAGKASVEKTEEVKKSHNPSGDKTGPKKRRARKKWKKPKDKPNRPLSAYNLFFQAERARMLGDDAKGLDQDKGKKRVHRKTHGKIGFAEMARSIGQKWKELPEEKKTPFLKVAAKEKERYAVELQAWKEEQKRKPKAGKSLVAALKAEQRAAEREEEEFSTGSKNKEDEATKLKMMAEEINQRNMLLMQQRSESEYLRALQERKVALMAGRSALDSSMYQQYPNASEASANALLQQFQNMPGAGLAGMGPMGMGMGMGMNPMGMNPMNMNSFGAMTNMLASDRLNAANRLQQLRAGLGTNMGDLQGMNNSGGMGNNNNNGNAAPGGSAQGDMGQLASPEMRAAMARSLQNRFNM